MTEAPHEIDPDVAPIRVTENVISAWRWDAWRDAATRIDRSSLWFSIAVGVVVAAIAAGVGFELLTGNARLSVMVYAPTLGWVVQAWTRSWTAAHRLKTVLDEVRPEVVPKLVSTLDNAQLLKILTLGGASIGGQATVILVEPRGPAVALTASEYDMTHFATYPSGDVAGG